MFGQQDNNTAATDNTGMSMPQPVASPAEPAHNTAVDPTVPAVSGYGGDGYSASDPAVAPVAAAMPADQPAAVPASDDLLQIKQQALQQLSPLVGHLDQTPEEKFRTTMMMIQASDNSALLKDAYAAAEQITDEKTKAQALLDVINEINYFSQQHEQ